MNRAEYIELALEGRLDEPDRFLHDDIIQRFIKPAYIKLEPELFRSKWFDYRFLTPFQATLLYAAYFEPIYSEQVQRYKSTAQAEFRKPIVFEKVRDEILHLEPSVKTKSNFAALYRGRAVADAIGCPYDFFLRTSFDLRMRAWQNSNLPRPHHLYSEDMTLRVVDEWNKYKSQMRLYPKHPAYKQGAYMNLAAQDDYREFIVEQAHLHSFSNGRMQQHVDEGMITPEQYDKFIADRLEKVRNPSLIAQ